MNQKKITIKEIAERANTSKTTVSFFLNGKTDKMSAETKDRIARVISETNYRPSAMARSLNAKSIQIIGVLIGDITNSFANQLVKGIDTVASEKGYRLIVGNSNYNYEHEESYINRMLEMGVDGFIVQPTSQFHTLLPIIENEHKSIVFIDSQIETAQQQSVKTNNYEAVFTATQKLSTDGYDNFIMLTADPGILSTRLERTQGFTDALAKQNKPCHTEIITKNVTPEQITELILHHIKLDAKTLIFTASCWLLPIVYMGLKQYRHLMPNTIGLLGFDNLEWTNFSSPTVTTIVQPAHEEGREACRTLINILDGIEIPAVGTILPCIMNWGESTAIKR